VYATYASFGDGYLGAQVVPSGADELHRSYCIEQVGGCAGGGHLPDMGPGDELTYFCTTTGLGVLTSVRCDVWVTGEF
jgi:hypothetical protein